MAGKSRNERTGALVTFRVDPRFDCLRSEPRFQQVLQNLHPSSYSLRNSANRHGMFPAAGRAGRESQPNSLADTQLQQWSRKL